MKKLLIILSLLFWAAQIFALSIETKDPTQESIEFRDVLTSWKIKIDCDNMDILTDQTVKIPYHWIFNGTEENTPPEDASLNWESSNPAVAIVNNAGEITGIAPGSAVITVSTDKYNYDYLPVRVWPDNNHIELSMADATGPLFQIENPLIYPFNYGMKAWFNGKDITDQTIWKSSNESIISVTAPGQLTAIKEGKSEITVSYIKDGEEYVTSLELNVVRTMQAVALPASEITSEGFTANWQSVEFADEYVVRVEYYDTTTQTFEKYKTFYTANTFVNVIADLKYGDLYRYSISTLRNNLDYATSEWVMVKLDLSGIVDIINTEGNLCATYAVYALDGRYVGDSLQGLSKGIYVVRQGNAAKKMVVK